MVGDLMERKLLLLCVIVLLSSCTYNQKIQTINSKLGEIEHSVNQNTSDLNTIKPRISAIEEKLNVLTEKINVLSNATESNKTTEKTVVEASLDNATNNTISKIPPASVVFSTKKEDLPKEHNSEQKNLPQEVKNNKKNNIERNLKAPSAQDLKSYEDALSTYMKRDFGSALDKFLLFLSNHPHTNLEQNTYFWVGSCYYNLNQYDKALDYFSECLNNFPKKPTKEGGKTDACLFMLYKTYKATGDTQKAYEYLMKLKKEYPINPYFEFRGVKN